MSSIALPLVFTGEEARFTRSVDGETLSGWLGAGKAVDITMLYNPPLQEAVCFKILVKQ